MTNINMFFDFNYVEQQYTIKFIGVADIVSRVGGYMASLMPLVRLSAPLFFLYFFYNLAEILSELATKWFIEKSVSYLKKVASKLDEIVILSYLHPNLNQVLINRSKQIS